MNIRPVQKVERMSNEYKLCMIQCFQSLCPCSASSLNFISQYRSVVVRKNSSVVAEFIALALWIMHARMFELFESVATQNLSAVTANIRLDVLKNARGNIYIGEQDLKWRFPVQRFHVRVARKWYKLRFWVKIASKDSPGKESKVLSESSKVKTVFDGQRSGVDI